MARWRRNPCAGRLISAGALMLLLTAAPSRAVEVGELAPSFQAPNLSGGENISLSAYRGRVVYLDFWASWCAPCLTSLPLLDGLRREFSHAGFEVVAVNVDRDPDKARRFLRERPVGYPSVTDPAGRLAERFEVPTMPTSYLIDRRGVVRRVHRGFRRGDLDALRGQLRSLLAEER